MLILILAESAIETIPQNLWKHPAVKQYSKRRGKPPQFLLLDRSYHHAAMKRLEENEKRGRPDIVHFSLLEALGSPLNKEQLLQTYVHTINDYVVTVNPEARLPRNYNRFVGLVEQLFELGRIPSTGPSLLMLERETLPQLLHKVMPSYVVAFSSRGSPKMLENAMAKVSDKQRLVVLIGGFPHGHFTETTIKLANEVVRIDPEMLEAWAVTARIIYEYERCIYLPKKRLER